VQYGETKPVQGLDLSRMTVQELVQWQLHPNEWYVRQARQVLADRAAAALPLDDAAAQLRELYSAKGSCGEIAGNVGVECDRSGGRRVQSAARA